MWGARSGIETLRTGPPRVDAYSWTAHGATWIPNSWGWNVLLGVFYRTAGLHLVGLDVVAALVALGAAATVAVTARRLGAAPLPTIAAFAPLGFLALGTGPRAQTLSNIMPLLMCALLGPAILGRPLNRARAIAALMALQAVWINLHSAALIGPVLFAAAGLAVAMTRPSVGSIRVIGRVALITAGLVGCCLLTPYGAQALLHAGAVRSASVGLVVEWQHAGVGNLPQLLGLLGCVLGLGLSYRAARAGRLGNAAFLFVLAAASAYALRFLATLGLFAVPELALAIGALKVRHRMFQVTTIACTCVLVLFAMADARDISQPPPLVSPALVSAVPSNCRLLNDDVVGDAVILLRPDVPVSLDTRNDLYGRDGVVTIEQEFQDATGTDERLRAQGVDCVLGPSASPLVKRLAADDAWRVLGTDRLRTLLVRSAGGTGGGR